MDKTANLGKSFTRNIKKSYEKFINWTSSMTAILSICNELNNNFNTIKDFDSALTDLENVSE